MRRTRWWGWGGGVAEWNLLDFDDQITHRRKCRITTAWYESAASGNFVH